METVAIAGWSNEDLVAELQSRLGSVDVGRVEGLLFEHLAWVLVRHDAYYSVNPLSPMAEYYRGEAAGTRTALYHLRGGARSHDEIDARAERLWPAAMASFVDTLRTVECATATLAVAVSLAKAGKRPVDAKRVA